METIILHQNKKFRMYSERGGMTWRILKLFSEDTLINEVRVSVAALESEKGLGLYDQIHEMLYGDYYNKISIIAWRYQSDISEYMNYRDGYRFIKLYLASDNQIIIDTHKGIYLLSQADEIYSRSASFTIGIAKIVAHFMKEKLNIHIF
ncbi:MAG: hypothetical protein KatS3mg096_651 [Candidatus Parcubacteria bacterium]|nr:MAG: hypothetical protein KatS3mg096_651 [Candidatus Parcubacteria bacterium]